MRLSIRLMATHLLMLIILVVVSLAAIQLRQQAFFNFAAGAFPM